MLAEQAHFHGASDEMMEGIVDIFNLLLLDGGCTVPLVASWKAFNTLLERRSAGVTSLYILCPHGCRDGATPMENAASLPRKCVGCKNAIQLRGRAAEAHVLRHFNVVQQMQAIFRHPGIFVHALRNTILQP